MRENVVLSLRTNKNNNKSNRGYTWGLYGRERLKYKHKVHSNYYSVRHITLLCCHLKYCLLGLYGILETVSHLLFLLWGFYVCCISTTFFKELEINWKRQDWTKKKGRRTKTQKIKVQGKHNDRKYKNLVFMFPRYSCLRGLVTWTTAKTLNTSRFP